MLLHPLQQSPDVFLYGKALSLDVETTTALKGWGPSAINPDNELVLACWDTHKGRHKHAWPEDGFDELIADIEQHDFIIAHNSKFEMQWLMRLGVDLRDILCFDTMLAEWVLHAGKRLPEGFLTLGKSLWRHGLPSKFDFIAALWKAGIDTRDIPRSLLLPYCHRDKDGGRQLYEKQVVLLSEDV